MIFHKKKSACLRAQTSSSTHANQFLQFQIFLQNCNHKITYNHKLFIHKIYHNHTKESFKNQSQSYIHIYLKKKSGLGLARRRPPGSGQAARAAVCCGPKKHPCQDWPCRRCQGPAEQPPPGRVVVAAGAWQRRGPAPTTPPGVG